MKPIECLLNSIFKHLDGGAVGSSVRLASRRLGVRIPAAKVVVKTGSDSSTVKRSAISVSVTVLGDDHSKRMPRVKVVVAR